jgi:hypothetical protein
MTFLVVEVMEWESFRQAVTTRTGEKMRRGSATDVTSIDIDKWLDLQATQTPWSACPCPSVLPDICVLVIYG